MTVVIDCAMIVTKSAGRGPLGQPLAPSVPTTRLLGQLKRNSREAGRRAAGIVAGAEWEFLAITGHGVEPGDRLEVEFAIAARPGSIFRVLDFILPLEGESDDRILLEFEAPTVNG